MKWGGRKSDGPKANPVRACGYKQSSNYPQKPPPRNYAVIDRPMNYMDRWLSGSWMGKEKPRGKFMYNDDNRPFSDQEREYYERKQRELKERERAKAEKEKKVSADLDRALRRTR